MIMLANFTGSSDLTTNRIKRDAVAALFSIGGARRPFDDLTHFHFTFSFWATCPPHHIPSAYGVLR